MELTVINILIINGAALISVLVYIVIMSFKFGKLIQRIDTIENDVKGLKEKTDELKNDISNIRGSFDAYEKMRLVQKGSPIILTEHGKELLEKSGGQEYINMHADDLYKKFENIDNAFDIQEKARNIIRDEAENKDFSVIKEYLYREGMSFDDLTLVMGIKLRDMVLHKKGMATVHAHADGMVADRKKE